MLLNIASENDAAIYDSCSHNFLSTDIDCKFDNDIYNICTGKAFAPTANARYYSFWQTKYVYSSSTSNMQ